MNIKITKLIITFRNFRKRLKTSR